ncbi:DoxX protein [Polaribacter sp. Hel1_33_78]|uniref:DoxX family membrane protein n=1 Tax=Polaribacter sp. Hel1_33_78 TaxID=1336804 RepID=UPI000879EBE7|nr:DoxX family membrane protein [Polaribacter sp. Hel1_33_78]SDU09649.1 DoxX protein [Polaribacter sp. Hel1_33_78]
MKKVKIIVRILLGLMVLIFGLNKFLQFMPMPQLPESAGEFMGALVKSGYLMQAVAIVEIVTGIMLLINRFQALALVILFPVLLNAFWFHLFLDPAWIAGAFIAIAMNQFLFFANKESYKSILKFKETHNEKAI